MPAAVLRGGWKEHCALLATLRKSVKRPGAHAAGGYAAVERPVLAVGWLLIPFRAG